MPRSANRRAAPEPRSRRRLLAAVGSLVVFGGIIGVTQISIADDNAETTAAKTVNGLEILANDCSESVLEPHDGFQKGERCVSTEFGEVGAQEKNPTLLITEAPRSVEVGKPFTLRVSTRNLVRDRFLAAGQGGYYVESSVLTQEGLVRGHFHTACRLLGSTKEAPDPAPVPAFFVATEDRNGSATPDTVTIRVPGIPAKGTAQCASWAGDGSHRIPMMQRANQTPAFDAVRIRVRAAEDQPPVAESPAPESPAPESPAPELPAPEPPAEEQPLANNNNDSAAAAAVPPPFPDRSQTSSGTVNRNTTRPADTSSNSSDNTSSSSSNNDDEQPAVNTQSLTGDNNKKAVTPESPTTEKSAEGASKALAGDDGAPDPDTPSSGIKPAAAQTPKKDKLALTGNGTLAVIGGGVVIALIGFVILSATRRRRPRASHYYQ